MAGALFRTKSIDRLLADAAASGEGTLKRTLGPLQLVALGIGAIIGAGLFVRTAAAIADRAGPSVDARLHRRRHRLRVRRPVLRRVRVDDPDRGQRLHLLVRHDGRAGRVDHRLGPGARIRRRRRDGRDRVERVLQQAARMVRDAHPVSVVPLAVRDVGDAGVQRHHEHPGGVHPAVADRCCSSAARRSRRSSTASSSSSRSRS